MIHPCECGDTSIYTRQLRLTRTSQQQDLDTPSSPTLKKHPSQPMTLDMGVSAGSAPEGLVTSVYTSPIFTLQAKTIHMFPPLEAKSKWHSKATFSLPLIVTALFKLSEGKGQCHSSDT